MLEDDGTVPLQWLPRPPLGWSRTPGSPPDSPQPLYGVCGETQEPCIREERRCVSQEKAWEAPEPLERSPRRCQHSLPALPANKGLPSQLPAGSRDKTCSVLHPDLLPSHNPHPGASPCRSSSSLGTLCLYHHHPPRLYQPHQGNGYHNPPAPSQTPGEGRKRSQPPPCGGQSILLHLNRERRAQQLEQAAAGSCQHPAVRAQIPWQPIRSCSWLPAGALDRGPGTGMNKRGSSTKEVDVGGRKPGSCSSIEGSWSSTGTTPCSGVGVNQGRLPWEPTQAELGMKPSGGQQKGLFVPPPLLLPFCSHPGSDSGIRGMGDLEQCLGQQGTGGGCRLMQCSPDTH